jgi:hypothetical protein
MKGKVMSNGAYRYIQPASVVFLLSMPSKSAWAEDPCKWVAPEQWFIYVVLSVILLGSWMTLMVIIRALRNSGWSLADALSEACEITAMEADASGANKIMLDADGRPFLITEMRASTSRVIALLGMIVILLIFLGFGMFALYAFAETGSMPDSIGKAVDFIVAGLTLFAPYVADKFSKICDNFSLRSR